MPFKIEKHGQTQSNLMSLPLELRHKIYDHLNFRGRWEERQIFRDYLNRIDPQQNYNGNTADQTFEDEGGEVGMNTDNEDEEGDDEDEEDIESEDEDEDEGEDGDNEGDDDGSVGVESLHETDESLAGADPHDQNGEQAVYHVPGHEGAADAVTSTNATATATAVHNVPPRPFNKYRHVPFLIHLSACPPQTNTLQLCQRINEEASNHYYDTNALHLDVTKSFQHLTFFEEMLDTIAEAAFSPLESLTKAKLRIVWDSAYVNALATSADPSNNDYERLLNLRGGLESSLSIRIAAVVAALKKSSNLRDLTVDIFDSKNGPEEIVLQNELLEPIIMMCFEKDILFRVHEHKLEDGQRPKRKSVIGRFRAELKELVEHSREIR